VDVVFSDDWKSVGTDQHQLGKILGSRAWGADPRGRQIGQVGDALRVLIRQLKPDELKPEEEGALKALEYQLDEVDRLKAKRRDKVRAPDAWVRS
jgi:hypothetical protein